MKKHHETTRSGLPIARFVGLALIGASSAQADTFSSGPNGFTIDFVNIGNAGNSRDLGAGGGIYSTEFGGVGYDFRIGRTEISQDMITKATNSGLTIVTAGEWVGNQPAAGVTWYEAAHFVNWLNTSTGHQAPYQLNANLTGLTLWSSADAWQLGGENLFRHKDAYYVIPSEDEWYKAAFHKNDGVTANYWDFAGGSNTVPLAVSNGSLANTAVYNHTLGPANVNDNGGFSPYGTRGQDGNVWEWQESAFDGANNLGSEGRTVRGGFWDGTSVALRSSALGRTNFGPATQSNTIGFRVASVIPEPSSAVLLLASGALLLARRRSSASVGNP